MFSAHLHAVGACPILLLLLLLLCVAAVVEVTAQQKKCMRQLHTLKVVIFYPEKLERFPVGKGGNC